MSKRDGRQQMIRHEDGSTIVFHWDDANECYQEHWYDSDHQAIRMITSEYNLACREWRRLQKAIERLNRTANGN